LDELDFVHMGAAQEKQTKKMVLHPAEARALKATAEELA
jgi:hypothetical protein